MLRRMRDTLSIRLPIAALAMLAANGTLFAAFQAAHGSRASLSKAAETITGRIAMVNPDQGLVILVREGPSEPAATKLSWTETRDPASGGVQKSPMEASQVPGETDYAFKIEGSTVIKVDGRRTSLDRLGAYRNQPATVRFLARRTGDFALEIKVGH
jgi:hypothetical protein